MMNKENVKIKNPVKLTLYTLIVLSVSFFLSLCRSFSTFGLFSILLLPFCSISFWNAQQNHTRIIVQHTTITECTMYVCVYMYIVTYSLSTKQLIRTIFIPLRFFFIFSLFFLFVLVFVCVCELNVEQGKWKTHERTQTQTTVNYILLSQSHQLHRQWITHTL